MSVAEPSDASANGFSPALKKLAKARLKMRRAVASNLTMMSPASTVSLLLCALFCVGFISFDLTNEVNKAESRLAWTARLVADRLANATVPEAEAVLVRIQNLSEVKLALTLTGQDGVMIAAAATEPGLWDDIKADRYIVGPLSGVEVSQSRFSAIAPAIPRALGVSSLFLLLCLGLVRAARRRQVEGARPSLSKALNALPHGVAFWSNEGHLLVANPMFAKAVGEDDGRIRPGATYTEVLDRLSRSGKVRKIAEHDGGRRSEISRPDGASFMLEEHASETGGFSTILSDFTQESTALSNLIVAQSALQDAKRQSEELRIAADAARRSKTSFLAHLNHEIRTPLNHIIGFADLIGHQSYGPLGDRRYATYVDHIKQSGESLLSSISNMLELAEFETGQKVLRNEQFRLSDLFDWAKGRFSDRAANARITFSISLQGDMLLRGDRLCLQRMLGNIVENALRFTPSGGEVSVVSWTGVSGVVLEVTDTGIGIHADKLSLLNEHFMLGDDGLQIGKDGSGLGIAIARSIAVLSGGEMMIDSSPAVGTTVAISLPAEAVMAKPMPAIRKRNAA